MQTSSQEKTIPKIPLGFTLYVTKPHRFLLFLTVFFVFLTELFVALHPLVLGRLVDSANKYTLSGEGTLASIGLLIFLYPFLRLLMAVSRRGVSFALHYVTAYMRTDASKILFEHLSLHSTSYFGERFAGSISSDINIVGQNIVRMTTFFTQAFFAMLFALLSGFFVIATASQTLAIFFVAGILLLIPVNYKLAQPTLKYSKIAAKTLSAFRGQLVDSITNITAMQQFARRYHELERIDDSIKTHQEADIKAKVYSEKIILLNSIIVIVFVGALMYGAFVLWSQGSITLGEFVMVVALTTSIVGSLSYIGDSINEFASIYGETKHVLEGILKDHDILDKPNVTELQVEKGQLDFNNVSFAYDESMPVFENLNLHIKPGERIGVVGVSGGGKSTLVKLLLRQYEIGGGIIEIDGQDISQVTQTSLRQSIGIVPQEPALFHRSLFENIEYGRIGATHEEVEEAAKKAQIHEFIMSLPRGYETMAGERGIKLSGGQRQRIAIARAILKSAPVLILDEATSALDSESETSIQKGLHVLMENKTVIAIAHRLSTIKEMDRIIVFEDGKIVQSDSHIKLLKDKKGVYARLWSHQADGFIVD